MQYPLKLVYGRPPPDLHRIQLGNAKEEQVDIQLRCQDVILKKLNEHSTAAKNRMVLQYKEGKWVHLKCPTYSLIHGDNKTLLLLCKPLSHHLLNTSGYLREVEFTRCSMFPNWRDATLLQQMHRYQQWSTSLILVLLVPTEYWVLGTKKDFRVGKPHSQWFIEWSSFEVLPATWEDTAEITERFPTFSPSEQGDSWGGSNVSY